MDASYQFLSWTRRGLATRISQVDTFGAAQPAYATAAVGVSIAGHGEVEHAARLRGPGDIIKLLEGQVLRTDPIDGAVGVEPNYFAGVEFDRPDLPWVFSPAAPDGERLRPWVVLVVVDLEGEQVCRLDQEASPLPVLHVPAVAAGQLPKLEASHLWAHAQAVAPAGMSVKDAVSPAADPRLSCSRLLCPRHLEPFRQYLGAVVPAFDIGRLAGLGQPITKEHEASLNPAWRGGAVELPVFHSFRFHTGEDADFEAIARRLQNRPLPPGVGVRPLDVSRPGAGLPAMTPPADVDDTTAIEWLGGALMPPVKSLPRRAAQPEQEFQAELAKLLDAPAELRAAGDEDPVVAPPIYGGRHAQANAVGSGSPPPWIGELNLSALDRVAAGLGTQVVQDRQEELVERAWQQLGDIRAANDLLRRSQLSRTLSARVHERLGKLAASTVLAVSAPAHRRLAGIAGNPETLVRAVERSRLPNVTVEPAFRRFAAAPLASRIVERFSAERFAPAAAPLDGVTTMRPATEVIGRQAAALALQEAGGEPGVSGVALDQVLQTLAANVTPLPSAELLRGAASAAIGGTKALAAVGVVPASAAAAVVEAASASLVSPRPAARLFPQLPRSIARPQAEPTHLPEGLALAPGAVDDERWSRLARAGAVPRAVTTAEPTVDAGSRLEAIRRDPVAIAALAEVAAGHPAEAVRLDEAVQVVDRAQDRQVLDQLAAGTFAPVQPSVAARAGGPADVEMATALRTAAVSAFGRMVSAGDGGSVPAGPALDLELVKRDLLARTDPEQTVVARVSVRLTLPPTLPSLGERRDALDPVVACPRFEDPMWRALREHGSEWLLPGLELILPDTATLVKTNPEFVAAHMVGLNHELMRELLWREFPTDERGTAFTRFWGRSGANPDDIRPVERFEGKLTDNVQSPGGEAVLLLRSELLRRYPGSIIYLSLGRQEGDELDLDGDPILPAFRGDIPPDVSFVGFPIAPEALTSSSEPFYFVIAQPPAEPRFGLDDPPAGGDPGAAVAPPASANDLNWSHMSPDGKAGTRASFAAAAPPALAGAKIEGLTWGESAAAQARLTYQHPVRVAIQARDLFPARPEGGEP